MTKCHLQCLISLKLLFYILYLSHFSPHRYSATLLKSPLILKSSIPSVTSLKKKSNLSSATFSVILQWGLILRKSLANSLFIVYRFYHQNQEFTFKGFLGFMIHGCSCLGGLSNPPFHTGVIKVPGTRYCVEKALSFSDFHVIPIEMFVWFNMRINIVMYHNFFIL